ncbi:MAG: DUF92 domain-containing protein [Candidatus Methylarchaceae archaeon HK02M1]|nr:DUF92 domain-containing protein [Candidatus Methylarchaceae archaeon HK02M1]
MLPLALEVMAYILIVFSIGLLALKVKAVDFGGAIACIFIGSLILIGGGWYWFIIMIIFFVVSIQFTRFRYNYKKKLGFAQEKGGVRSWSNALANGGVATIFAVTEFFFGGGIYEVAFLGAMASATADTLATEIGLLSKQEPKLITNLRKRVPIGTSGGVTPIGTISAFFASFFIGAVATLLGMVEASPIEVLTIVTIGGIIGCIMDSFLGALIQRIGLCEVCGKTTENLRHCGKPIERLRGFNFVDNNVVNFLSTLSGAISSMALFTLV